MPLCGCSGIECSWRSWRPDRRSNARANMAYEVEGGTALLAPCSRGACNSAHSRRLLPLILHLEREGELPADPRCGKPDVKARTPPLSAYRAGCWLVTILAKTALMLQCADAC